MQLNERGKRRLTITSNTLLQIRNLPEGRILAARTQEISERVKRDLAVSTLVEERESFLVVRRGLVEM